MVSRNDWSVVASHDVVKTIIAFSTHVFIGFSFFSEDSVSPTRNPFSTVFVGLRVYLIDILLIL